MTDISATVTRPDNALTRLGRRLITVPLYLALLCILTPAVLPLAAILAIVLCFIILTERDFSFRIGDLRVDVTWFYVVLLGLSVLFLIERPKFLAAESDIILVVSGGISIAMWVSVQRWTSWFSRQDIVSFVMIFSAAIFWTLSALRSLIKLLRS